jgi:hypothetical protein
MATAKQLALRAKYAKMTIGNTTKKLVMAQGRLKKLEAELKKAQAAEKKVPPKKVPAKKKK